jgi:GTP-binding protein Era
MIKEIGKMARKQLEVFLQQQVYLELEVVVRSDWRRDREALRELGYEP